MSVMNEAGTKIVLERGGPDHFWKLVEKHYAGEDPTRWKYLAMLALRENAAWTVERIGYVFGHPKGHVSRCLVQIKRELRDRFQMSPNMLDVPEDADAA